ncbi:histidine phosphatase family protein [Acetobacteraceae bacterium KSS8]|uniref:Histidine phosphatase family protein n=2 Tax=Endosaccharibacter trunci TaxID=2812733 RepID=A0ABT1W2J3_9PROT|nr:histidine phosphatase family protein [Acetobacteraceae bacterium KSS8]
MPALADRIRPLRPLQVVSSPAVRCVGPASLLAGLLGAPLRTDADLRELDFGDWEGLRWDEVPRPALDAWASDPLGFAPPAGESGTALIRRVRRAADRLRAEGNALVVSHGGPLRLLPAILCGETPNLLDPAPGMGSLRIVTMM